MKRIIIFLEGADTLSVDEVANTHALGRKTGTPKPTTESPAREWAMSIAETIGSMLLIKALLWKDVFF